MRNGRFAFAFAWGILTAPAAALAGSLEPPGPPAPTMRTLESLGFDCPTDPPGTTNLMFPVVSVVAGFDTTLLISNTGADPFGTVGQSGTCTVNFYGSSAPMPVVTASVAPGGQAAMTGSVVAPGFSGYAIAVCNFAYAHGFAVIASGPVGPDNTVLTSYLATTICRDRKWNLGTGQ